MLTELAEGVREDLLLGVVSDGIGGGLVPLLRRQPVDEARACIDALEPAWFKSGHFWVTRTSAIGPLTMAGNSPGRM